MEKKQLLAMRNMLFIERDKEHDIDKIRMIDSELADTEQKLVALGEKIYKPDKGKIDLSVMLGVENKPEDNGMIFVNPTQTKMIKRNSAMTVPSGIDGIDKAIRGFNKGELNVWSGSNGSGKSSILSQLALESSNNGFKTALFSGELPADKAMNWIQLQCAGKNYTKPTKYENYYTLDDVKRREVNEWLDGKLFIYNNDCGLKVEFVTKAIDDLIAKEKIDVVIIDNLMAMDLGNVQGERYEKQTNLVMAMSQLARKRNVVIHFVAHPRKAIGFLRKTDISGTADITNIADNVFIVHRVGTDFKRAIKEYMMIKDDDAMMFFSNVIEICKNRDLGVVDQFIGLYYEKESKRFLNYKTEEKKYKWESVGDDFYNVEQEKLPFDE